MNIRKYTFKDTFEVSTKVAVVSDLGRYPEWLQDMVVSVTADDIRVALLRYPDSLLRKIERSPKQMLQRVPLEFTPCTLRKGCMGWDSVKCQRLATNECLLLSLSRGDDVPDIDLTEAVNLLREGYSLVFVN